MQDQPVLDPLTRLGEVEDAGDGSVSVKKLIVPPSKILYRLPPLSAQVALILSGNTSQGQVGGVDSMKRLLAVVALISASMLGLALPASAFVGGGRKPSEAPLIAVGQHYNGELTNQKSDANYNGSDQIAVWRLPSLTTRDVIYVDWHSVPRTHDSSSFPLCMTFAQGVDDYNWGTRFGEAAEAFGCEAIHGPVYRLSGSGTVRTEIVAQENNSNSSYLEFYTTASETTPSEFESFPYDFTVEPILHYLGLAIQPPKELSATSVLSATATLATGQPAPDGLTFNLEATWADGGVASYSATSSGGAINFQLALPETAYGKNVAFVASHPADGAYQGVTSEKLRVKVANPPAPPLSACVRAKRQALSLTRQLKRLKRHERFARGGARRRLGRRARSVARKLRTARARSRAACA